MGFSEKIEVSFYHILKKMKKLKLIIKLIAAFMLILQTTAIYGQDSIIKPYSIYFNQQQIDINDPNLYFRYRHAKKGLKFFAQYKDTKLKAIVYKKELCSTDSIQICLSGYAKKKDVNVIECHIVGNLHITSCLRCKNSFLFSCIYLYKPAELFQDK